MRNLRFILIKRTKRTGAEKELKDKTTGFYTYKNLKVHKKAEKELKDKTTSFYTYKNLKAKGGYKNKVTADGFIQTNHLRLGYYSTRLIVNHFQGECTVPHLIFNL